MLQQLASEKLIIICHSYYRQKINKSARTSVAYQAWNVLSSQKDFTLVGSPRVAGLWPARQYRDRAKATKKRKGPIFVKVVNIQLMGLD